MIQTNKPLQEQDNPDRLAEIAADKAWRKQQPIIMSPKARSNEDKWANRLRHDLSTLPAPESSNIDKQPIPSPTLGDIKAEKASEAAWDRLEEGEKETEIKAIAETVGNLAVGNPPTEEVQILPDGNVKVSQPQ